MSETHNSVARLWSLCNLLKDDGVTYHQYVTELTYLLFLKMAKETGFEEQIAKPQRWDALRGRRGESQLDAYRATLAQLGGSAATTVREIFANARTTIKKATTLGALVDELNRIDWFSAREEGLGNLYEGLLEKNANDKRSGAGQYFTPRALIDSMVAVTRPSLDDVIQDPAAGTGGFLVAAARYIREHESPESWTTKNRHKFEQQTFYGIEHVQDTHRLALMNLTLHGLKSSPRAAGVRYGDTLSPDGQSLPKATLIVTNPPFGVKKGGGLPTRKDLPFATSNKQLCFLQHVILSLAPGGRAAVVLPDNVLFEAGVGREIRVDLMERCNLHTILRLPAGIFYAAGVKTNVLFFTRGQRSRGNTKGVWFYDLRMDMPQFGKRTTLEREHFAGFEAAYGTDPFVRPASWRRREASHQSSRFHFVSRKEIVERDDNLDVVPSHDGQEILDDTPELAGVLHQALSELHGALDELRLILAELGEPVEA